jgi:hypothetical protein
VLARQPALASTLVLVLSGAVGAAISLVVFQLPFHIRQPAPGDDILEGVGGFLLAIVAGPLAASGVASAALKKWRLPLAQVPWYVFGMGYVGLGFAVLSS